jgi:alpha-1,2-mannosyltransferase
MPVGRSIRLASFAVAAFSSPFLVDLNLGNVSTFVLLLTVVGWRWLDRPPASLALAAGVAIRPQLGVVLLWWLARRKARAFAWTIVAGAVLFVLTLPFVGLSSYVDFLRVIRNDQVAGVAHNGSLESAAILLGLSGPVPTLAFLAGAALAVVAILVSLRRDAELSYAVTVCAGLLLTPLLWGHYLLVLLIPAALLANRGRAWALVLPLLGWLPDGAISIAAFAGMLLPLVVPTRPATSDVEASHSAVPAGAPALR